ncbi:tape measure protein [Deferrisoma camini]|uniref:tape measure protein n=1 Tax=Deferrisoma camini TaxID=1035120 RepID=UPI00046D597C|nr:tape measure protein [Deferrisoma camini]
MNRATIDILMRFKDQAARPLQRTLRQINRNVQRTTRLVFSLKAAFAALGAGLVAKSFLDTATQFERFELQLKTIEGSAAAAKRSLDWITEFTSRTPYEIAEVTAAFVKLKAYGIDPTEGTLRTLGDTAAAMGKSLDQAVEAFADASQGEFERLKEFGIRARSTADEVTFAWTDAMGRMREVTVAKRADIIRETLAMIWNDRYAGGMEELSTSWSGMWSNLLDRLTLFKRKVMESGPFMLLKERLSSFLDELDRLDQEGKLTEWADRAGQAIVQTFDRAVKIVKDLKTPMQGLVRTFKALIDGFRALPTWMKEVGIFGALVGGVRGRFLLLGMAVAAERLRTDALFFKARKEGIVSLKEWFTNSATSDFESLSKLIEERAGKETLERLLGVSVPKDVFPPAQGTTLRFSGTLTEEDRLKALIASEEEWGASFADLKRRLNEPLTPDAHWAWIDPTEGAERWARLMEEQARKIGALMDNATTNPLRRLKEVGEQDWGVIQEIQERFRGELVETAGVAQGAARQIQMGFGSAFAQSLVYGQKFSESMKGLFSDLASYVTSVFARAAVGSVFGLFGLDLGFSLGSIFKFHDGGEVPALPRAHTGLNLAPDEVPIIAQTGERILSREQNREWTDWIRREREERSRPAVVELVLDGRTLAQALVDLAEEGRFPVVLRA